MYYTKHLAAKAQGDTQAAAFWLSLHNTMLRAEAARFKAVR